MSVLYVVGALFNSFLVSRVLLWFTRRWNGGKLRYVVIHAGIAGSQLVAAIWNTGTGLPAWSMPIYVLTPVVWLSIDLLAHHGRHSGTRSV